MRRAPGPAHALSQLAGLGFQLAGRCVRAARRGPGAWAAALALGVLAILALALALVAYGMLLPVALLWGAIDQRRPRAEHSSPYGPLLRPETPSAVRHRHQAARAVTSPPLADRRTRAGRA